MSKTSSIRPEDLIQFRVVTDGRAYDDSKCRASIASRGNLYADEGECYEMSVSGANTSSQTFASFTVSFATDSLLRSMLRTNRLLVH